MTISGVTNMLAGTTQVVRAYAGTTEVWNPTPTPTGIPADEIWYTTVSGQVEDLSTACTLTGMTIVSNTYSGGKGVMKFSAALTELPDMAFYYSPTLVSVELPPQVTVLGTEAFRDCKQLTAVTLNSDLTTIREGTFRGSTIPSFVIPDSVTSLGDYAFRYCQSLTALTIGSGITSIGYQVFQKCDILPSITIPDSVTTIGNEAFSRCNAASSITIGSGVTSIGEKAFEYCNVVSSITIPDSVTTIGKQAFSNCAAASSITIGSSVTSIGQEAFKGSSALTFINYDSIISDWNSIYKGGNWSISTNLSTIFCTDGEVWIGRRALYYTTSDGQVATMTSSPSIKYNSYVDGRGVIAFNVNLTAIPTDAFKDNTGLTSVIMSSGVTTMGENAFSGCTALSSITYGGTMSQWGSVVLNLNWATGVNTSVVHCIDGNVTIVNPTGVPANELWYTTSDGQVANINTTYLSGVTLDSNTYSGGKGIIKFSGTLTNIPDSAFTDNNKITSIKMSDSVIIIGFKALYNCSSLSSVTIGSNVEYIGQQAIANCPSLSSITVPQSVTGTGSYVFEHSTALSSVTILNNNMDIAEGILKDVGLVSVSIPGTVPKLSNYIFQQCSRLTSITIGTSVTTINTGAFRSVPATAINYTGTMSQWNLISKGSLWKYQSSLSVVHCTDGDVSI